MFWKRKGKKKDGEAGGGSAAVTLDETRDDAEDTQEGADTADAETGSAASANGAEGSAAKDAKGSAAKKSAAKKSPENGSKAEESDESGKTEDSEDTADTADTEDADSAGAEGAAGGDAADAPDSKDAADSGAEDSDAEDAGDTAAAGEDGDSEESADAEDEEGEDAAPKRASRPIEPEEPGIGEADSDGIQRVRTEGLLNVDDEEFSVVSNTWIVKADDEGVIVVDPAHDAEMILEAVGDREIYLVACTNAYNTHIAAALEVAERDEAPIALHRREVRAWRRVHGAEHRPEIELEGGGSLAAGDLEIDVLPLPGTSPGTVGFSIPELGAVFSGDTLRAGELGTVGEGYIDYTRQLHSVGEVLLSLPPDTRVLPDQGPETTVEEESGNFSSWV